MKSDDIELKEYNKAWHKIPMDEIWPEVRRLAVLWTRDRHDIQETHKLAQDIQNMILFKYKELDNLGKSETSSPDQEGVEELMEAYKNLLRIAGCPEILIENPSVLSRKANENDIEWAKKEIEKWQAKAAKTNTEGEVK